MDAKETSDCTPQKTADPNADLTVFVEELLGDMQQKFQKMSEQIVGRLDDMGKRVDDMEHNINELMKQVNESEDTKVNK